MKSRHKSRVLVFETRGQQKRNRHLHRGVESWSLSNRAEHEGNRYEAVCLFSFPKMRKPIRQPSEGNDSRTMTRFVSSYARELHGSRNVNADRSYNVDGQCRFTRLSRFSNHSGCAISPGFLPSFLSNFFLLWIKKSAHTFTSPLFSSRENFLLLEGREEMRGTARFVSPARVCNSR